MMTTWLIVTLAIAVHTVLIYLAVQMAKRADRNFNIEVVRATRYPYQIGPDSDPYLDRIEPDEEEEEKEGWNEMGEG